MDPLMQACENGHEQCALALIKAGAAVDKQGPQEWTALMFACSRRSRAVRSGTARGGRRRQ